MVFWYNFWKQLIKFYTFYFVCIPRSGYKQHIIISFHIIHLQLGWSNYIALLRNTQDNMHQKITLLILGLFSFWKVYSQDTSQFLFKGIIKDTSGNPLSRVEVKSRKFSTFTDSTGLFRIKSAKGDTLMVISQGYPTKYLHADTDSLVVMMQPDSSQTQTSITVQKNVTVKDTTAKDTIPITRQNPLNTARKRDPDELEDVVVIGYGTQLKRDLTGAIASINGAEIVNRPISNNISALQGISPGLIVNRSSGQPGQEGYTLQTRGYTSVNGGNLLGLVDGVNGDISAINPYDIESITVLKDASAAAIYGARAAGGVVLLTTKRGKKGFHINYNSLFGIQKSVKRPNRLHSWEEAEMANEARVNANANANPLFDSQEIEWMHGTDHNYQIDSTNPDNYRYYYDLNQIPLVVGNSSFSTTQNLAISGGSGKENYYFSLGYYDQNGLFKIGPDQTNRVNLRFNYNNQFNSIFDISSKIAYRNSKTLAPSYGSNGIFDYLYSAPTYFPIYLPGTDNYISNNQGNYAYAYLQDGGSAENRFDEFNTLFQLRARNFIDGISLRTIYGGRYTVAGNEIGNRTIPLYNRKGIASKLNNPNSYEKDRNLTWSNNVQLLADYDKKIGGHSFHLLGGYTYEDFRQDNTTAIAKNLSSNDLMTLNTGDPALAQNAEDIQTWAMSSFLGRLEYNFNSKYLFQATIRYDGNSRLDPSSRWQTFPSLSAGWRLAEESWFKKILPFFNEFKIRGSWGRLGNSDGINGVITNYDYIPMLVNGDVYPFNDVRNPSYYQSILPTKNKRWEIVDTKNVGLDLALLKNRLGITADYYIRNNFNMLVTPAVPSFIGITPSSSNNGRFETRGWEIALSWNDHIGDYFSYWVKGNLSDNTNKVISYGGVQSVMAGQNYVIEGFPINTLWGYQATGLYQSQEEVTNGGPSLMPTRTAPGDIKYLDLNGDKAISVGKSNVKDHGDLVNFGDTYPHYLYGFSLGFKWKGIDFSTLFQGVGKRRIMASIPDIYPYSSETVVPLDFNQDYWTATNTDARFPRLYLNGTQNMAPSSFWMMDGAYLRLKNLQIGYTLPASWLSRARVSSLRLFFTGQDLWEKNNLWIKSLDPETASGTSWRYPIMRNYSFGINLNF